MEESFLRGQDRLSDVHEGAAAAGSPMINDGPHRRPWER